MKSKKLSEAIIKTFKSNGFVLSEPDILLDSDYIIERSGEKFRSSMLTFDREDGKTMCLRPDLTVASCISFLQNKSSNKILKESNLKDKYENEEIIQLISLDVSRQKAFFIFLEKVLLRVLINLNIKLPFSRSETVNF